MPAKLDEPLDIVWSRPLPEGAAPSTVTVARDAAGRWFVSLLCDDRIGRAPATNTAVGVDAGLNNLLTLSTGEKITNPRHEHHDRTRLARAQRELSRKEKGDGRNRAKARLKVARVHARITDRRRDHLHKLTTRLVRENQTIVIEDLTVRNMVKNLEDLLSAYDRQMRTPPRTPPAGVTYETDGPLVRIVGDYRGMVRAPRDVGVRGTEVDRLIARQRDYFAARGEAVEWKTRRHDEPADLADRLVAAGFVAGRTATVLIAPAQRVAATPVLPEGVTLRRVTADADLRRIADLQSAVWGADCDWIAEGLRARVAAAPDEIAILVAEAGGAVVCAAWLVLHLGTEFAALVGGSTLPAAQGKGIYRALVNARARLAAARGFTLLQVDASARSAPILRRMGFEAVTTTTPYVWSPAAG